MMLLRCARHQRSREIEKALAGWAVLACVSRSRCMWEWGSGHETREMLKNAAGTGCWARQTGSDRDRRRRNVGLLDGWLNLQASGCGRSRTSLFLPLTLSHPAPPGTSPQVIARAGTQHLFLTVALSHAGVNQGPSHTHCACGHTSDRARRRCWPGPTPAHARGHIFRTGINGYCLFCTHLPAEAGGGRWVQQTPGVGGWVPCELWAARTQLPHTSIHGPLRSQTPRHARGM